MRVSDVFKIIQLSKIRIFDKINRNIVELVYFLQGTGLL